MPKSTTHVFSGVTSINLGPMVLHSFMICCALTEVMPLEWMPSTLSLCILRSTMSEVPAQMGFTPRMARTVWQLLCSTVLATLMSPAKAATLYITITGRSGVCM